MFRLLVIDDEWEVLDWLYTMFAESSLPLEVYKAQFASDALALMETAKIDIVLSDIRMPGMNGLQMMEAVRARWPQCKVVFLTGYDQFEYAHAAIKLGASGFVLKNEGDEVILENVARLAAELEKNALDSQLLSRAKEHANRISHLEARQLVLTALHGGADSRQTVRQRMAELGLSLDVDREIVLVLGCFEGDEPIDRSKLDALMLKGSELFGDRMNVFGMLLEEDQVLWILQDLHSEPGNVKRFGDEEVTYLEGTVEALQYSCLKTMNRMTAFVIGGEPSGWSTVAAKLNSFKHKLRQSGKNGNGAIIVERMPIQVPLSTTIAGKQSIQHQLSELGSALERGERDALSNILRDLKDREAMRCFWWEDAALQQVYASVALSVLTHLNRLGLSEHPDFREQMPTLMHAELHPTWEEALGYLERIALRSLNDAGKDSPSYNRRAVEQVCQLIREQPGEDLSLLRLARHAGFNPSYFSRLFKSTTGQNLIEYIQEVKVQTAKMKLAETDIRVNQLSIELGFASAHYFSRFFKLMTGVTPQEYREKSRNA